MSELRVALIAEGPTDSVLIEAALKAILGRPFTLVTLQPEATRPLMGTGWCGVFKWCREFAARSHASLEADPTLPGYDLFVIHVDADVAEKSYADGGAALVAAAQGLLPLPCVQPCPPPAGAPDELRERVRSWLGLVQVGPRTVLCVPSKAIEAWLAAGVLEETHPLLNGLECMLGLETQLAGLSKGKRIKKTRREYEAHAGSVTREWERVTQACTQAERFHGEVRAALGLDASLSPSVERP
jgi:hypothetical protein